MPQHLAEGPELPQQSLLAQLVAQQQAADVAMEEAAEAATGAAATATTAAAIHVGEEYILLVGDKCSKGPRALMERLGPRQNVPRRF